MTVVNKNKVVIRVMGRNYPILTEQEPDQVQRVARYVDRKMREIAVGVRANDMALAVVSSMTLADELFRAQDENVRLKKELEKLLAEQKNG